MVTNNVGSANDAADQRGIIVLNSNQRIVGTPSLVSSARVQEIREAVLNNPEATGQTVRTFQNMTEMQTFLASRRIHVLLRVGGVLQDQGRLLSPEEIDNFVLQNNDFICAFNQQFPL